MAEKELTKMTEEEMLEKAKQLKAEADALLAAAMRIENELEHDYITPEEEMERYAEIFKKSQELCDKKTEMVAEALKNNYRKVLELLECCRAVH
jgi:hypothetical protein